MKISQAQIQLSSHHVYQREQRTQESLRTWVGNERPHFADDPPAVADPPTAGDRLSLSTAAKRQRFQKSLPPPAPAADPISMDGEDPKLLAMRLILEALTGRKIAPPALEKFSSETAPSALTPQPEDAPGQAPNQAPPRAGWGLEYDYHEVTAEHEHLSFAATGQVLTEDGRQLDVTLELSMVRDFVATEDIRIRAGDALLIDPLVINFADQPPGLTDQKFAFDLDGDGKNEQISLVAPGSGLLFLDRNQDGQATDGLELFGPASDHGFAELAAFDSDGNGWLDDNDPMFAKLQLWTKDAVGADYFAPLKSKNIGAILLGHQATPFSLNDGQNTQLGQLTDSGIFLREDGNAGTIQEIRLAV